MREYFPPLDNYRCSVCGATGVKLWREYQTVNPRLLCIIHAAEKAGIATPDLDGNGMHISLDPRSDQIGPYVPAVPDEEGIGYWGYTSVPERAVNWWKALPTLTP